MSRSKLGATVSGLAVLGSLIAIGGANVGASAAGSMAPPCPPSQLVRVYDGVVYVHVGCASAAVPLPSFQLPPI